MLLIKVNDVVMKKKKADFMSSQRLLPPDATFRSTTFITPLLCPGQTYIFQILGAHHHNTYTAPAIISCVVPSESPRRETLRRIKALKIHLIDGYFPETLIITGWVKIL
jgi:hypothetical protein